MTREEAIKRLEIIATNLCGQSAQNPNLWPDYKAVDIVISALRRKDVPDKDVGNNEPLTLDELRQMDGEPVWIVYGEDEGMWALVEVCEESIFLTNNLGGRTEYADDVELEDDGVMVYRQKPEEVQK